MEWVKHNRDFTFTLPEPRLTAQDLSVAADAVPVVPVTESLGSLVTSTTDWNLYRECLMSSSGISSGISNTNTVNVFCGRHGIGTWKKLKHLILWMIDFSSTELAICITGIQIPFHWIRRQKRSYPVYNLLFYFLLLKLSQIWTLQVCGLRIRSWHLYSDKYIKRRVGSAVWVASHENKWYMIWTKNQHDIDVKN
jgi:hypothetical protein